MIKLIGVFIALILFSSVITPYAFADRFSEWLEVWKKQEELKAKEYQKKVMSLDYDKIKKKDKGFKGPIQTKVADKKHIDNKRLVIKSIKS